MQKKFAEAGFEPRTFANAIVSLFIHVPVKDAVDNIQEALRPKNIPTTQNEIQDLDYP